MVSAPAGRFTTETNPLNSRHVVGIAVGSGITPIAAIVKSVLLLDPHSRCTLVYGNKDPDSVMLADDLAGLTKKYGDRLHLVRVYTRHDEGDPERYGRLTPDRFRALVTRHAPDVAQADEAFLYGPVEMTQGVRGALVCLGLADDRVHTERFTAGAPTAPSTERDPAGTTSHDVIVIDQGTKTTVTVEPGETVLDAGLRTGRDLPYSCQEGICGSCRAKSTGGPVRLDECDLNQSDIDAGYALTCPTRPLNDTAVIDFDQT